ncbi:MAG: hypothetical protein P8Z76_18375 [Alphaproteobacteria bacterium]
MNWDENSIFRVNQTVEYTTINGTTESISPGKHRARAVHARGVPTSEAELECWLIEENKGAEGEMVHDVDAETVAKWQDTGAVEIGESAPSEI